MDAAGFLFRNIDDNDVSPAIFRADNAPRRCGRLVAIEPLKAVSIILTRPPQIIPPARSLRSSSTALQQPLIRHFGSAGEIC